MKRLNLVVLALAYTLNTAMAQQAIEGRVIDARTQEPLFGATVLVAGSEKGSITDEKGRFWIKTEPTDTLLINYVGYSETQIIVGNQQDFTISLSPDYQLENLIIKGVRALPDAPVVQTTLNRKDIERNYVGQHPIFILDKKTPGVLSYSESGTSVANYGNIRMRGISQERINFTLNGVPLNDMIDHGVFFSNFSDIANSFESIQVQRGVGTSSNGVSSYGGSVNFETINLKRNPAFSAVELGAGSFNTFRANYSVNTGISDKGFGFYSGFSRLWSDGYKEHTSSDAYSFFLTGGYYGEKDMVRLTTFTARSQNGLGYYTIDRSIIQDDPTYNILTENDKDDFSQYLIQLQHSHQFNNHWNMTSSLYYGGAGGDFAEGTPDEDSVYVENYFSTYYTTFFQINYPLKNDHFGLISNLFYEDEHFNFSAGIHAYTFLRENRESILPDDANPYYFERSHKNEFSGFAKADLHVGPVTFFGDVQFRTMQLSIAPDYSYIGTSQQGNISKSWTFINPKIGVTHQINKHQQAFISYGSSGREPTKVDLFGGFQLNASNIDFVRTDTVFNPEYVNDLEAGYKLNYQRLSLDATLYYMQFKDEIAPIGEVVAFGVQKRSNIPKSSRAGLEIGWNWLPTSFLTFSGTLAYLKTQIDQIHLAGDATQYSNLEQVLSPNWIVNGTISAHLSDHLSAALSGRYISDQYMELTNDPVFRVPSSTVFDISVNFNINSHWSAAIMLNNLFDRQYYTYGAPSDVNYSGTTEPGFLIQAPRNLFVTTRISF